MSESLTNGLSIQDLSDTRGTVYVAIAGFTVLVWDHLMTLDDEIEFVWKSAKGLLVYLFLINRYLTPLGFIVNLVAFTLSDWGTEVRDSFIPYEMQLMIHSCRHFVRYEGAMTVIGTQTAGLIMFLRVRALYDRQKVVVWTMVLLFAIWLGVNAWLLANGEAVRHASGVHSCSMIFDATMSDIASASAWLPLLYDTSIFALTLYKTMHRRGRLVRTLLSDGILYYSLICVVNVALTIMIVRAAEGVKNITAQLELLLTVAMVSRISLNLRKQASEDTISVVLGDWKQKTPRKICAGSSPGSGARLRASTAMSTMDRQNDITFRSESTPYPERIRLSTIYSIDLTPEEVSPSAASLDSGEAPGWTRSESREEIEAM